MFVLLVKGYIFSGYKFQPNEFRTALYLIAASFIALFGAWFQLRRRHASEEVLKPDSTFRKRTLAHRLSS